jgi:hypothetical protein
MPTHEQMMVDAMRANHDAWVAEKTAAQEVAAVQPETPAEPQPELVEKEAAGIVFKSAYVSDGGVIYAIAATSGTVDLDDDVLSTAALVQMSHDFTSAGKRTFKANHTDAVEADLVASMTGAPLLKSGKILSPGQSIPTDDPLVGLSLEGEPTCWVVGIRPTDKAVADLAKAGGIAGLSWGAYAKRVPLEE